MDWKKYWNKIAILNPDNTIGQVQRKDKESTILTVNHIVRTLGITRKDKVLDVCCGNGILTYEVAKKCASIVGVDQSKNLLKIAAKKHNEVNIKYEKADAASLSQVLKDDKFDKIYLQFSFQYFDKRGVGEKVIAEMLKSLNPDGKIFIGDIPNYAKRSDYYKTLVDKVRYYKDRVLLKNEMGKFWKVSEIDNICKKLNVKGAYMEQSKELPYSHYRFDYLIEN